MIKDPATDPEHDETMAHGAALRQQILNRPDMLTEDEFRQRIKESHAARLPESLRVLVLTDEAGAPRFPAWQINLFGLGRVLAMLEPVDPWTQHRFLTGPDTALDGRTPIAALKDGDIGAAVAAARQFVDMELGGN